MTDHLEDDTPEAHRTHPPLLVALTVFVAALVTSAVLIWNLDLRRLQDQRLRVAALASDQTHAIQTAMERALSTTYALAAMVRQGRGDIPDFEGVATQMLPLYPGVSVLGMAPGGVITRVVPLAGNEKSVGFNPLKDPVQGREAIMARDTGKLTLAGPFPLVQGGLGVVGRLPIFLDDAYGRSGFWGFVYVVIRFPDALADARLPQLTEQGIGYELWRTNPDTQRKQVIATSSPNALASPVEQSLALPNGTWTLSVAPFRGWSDPGGLLVKAAMGLLFSLVLAYTARLLLELRNHKIGLETLVARRTAEITATQHRLQATLSDLRVVATAFNAQQGMVILDADKVIVRANPGFTQITGYTPEDVAGKSLNILNSALHDRAFYDAMWASVSQHGTWAGEVWNRRKNGDIYPDMRTMTTIRNDEGIITHYVGTFNDITDRKASEDEIRKLAFYDPLTQLPNRRLLLDRLRHAQAVSARSGQTGAVQFIDLDNFKTLNDTLGHDAGDLLLQEVAKRLVVCMREGDTVARLGGDEFVVMLEELSENRDEAAAQAKAVGEKVLDSINQPYPFMGHDLHITPSIGVVLYSGHEKSIDELLKQADLAMYQAKAAGRNTLRFFDPAMQAVVSARVALESDIRQGLQREQFELYYQAQINGVGRTIGAEVLLRWPHPARGMVPPVQFIPLAEDTGLILPLGNWVLETACARLVAWSTQPDLQHLTLAVNVSARQFRQADFVAYVLGVLEATGANPARLKLELTESMLVNDVEDTIAKMVALKARGVGFSLDDFGTGYSSLSYLKRLPLDQLKIDQSFVRDLLTDPNDAAIARTVIALGHSLGLMVIAEGVETLAQRDFLAAQGCGGYQGYLFGRPVPAADFETSLRSH